MSKEECPFSLEVLHMTSSYDSCEPKHAILEQWRQFFLLMVLKQKKIFFVLFRL